MLRFHRAVFRVPVAVLFVRLLAVAPLEAATINDSWPRQFTTPKGNTVVVYQPQVEALKGDMVTCRAAVSVTKKDESAPKFGVVFASARVAVDRDERTVSILSVKVNRVRFPGITDEKEKKFATLLEQEIPTWQLVLSYDRLLENLKIAESEKRSAEGLKNDPPRILFAEQPTVLVTIDGEPRLSDLEGVPLRVVANTPFLMVLDTRDEKYYLAGGKGWWYQASQPKGPWQSISGPPAEIQQLADQADEKAAARIRAKAGTDGGEAEDDGTSSARPPAIAVTTEPTELIVSEGKPSFKPVAGGDLLYMDNTESDVLMDLSSQEYYVLLSGRWFRSRSLTGGPWAYVSPEALPGSFSKIPPDSDIGDVLASVPGTDEAQDAVLDAQIPQTTAVKRSEAALDVAYDGEPQFSGIEGTGTEYAINTSTSVLKIHGRYYACENAVWYVADSPNGPWAVADSIPREEIDQIPPSVPVYNVKYVTIYDATPDVVYVGYTPGYLGCYPWYGTVVWGTGWYYRPWISSRFFWPRPYTWGFHAHYNAWTGWGFGISWSFPFFRTSIAWGGAFRPAGWGYRSGWGGWHRAGWWGPGGYRPPVTIVNNVNIRNVNISRPGYGYPQRPGVRVGLIPGARPNIGFHPSTRQIRPEMYQHNVYNRLPAKARGVPRPIRGVSRAVPSRGNDVYAGRNGEIYRRTKDGQWQQRDKDRWRTTGASTPRVMPQARPASPAPERPVTRVAPRPELERDFSARQRGETRARDFNRGGGPPRSGAPPKGKGGESPKRH